MRKLSKADTKRLEEAKAAIARLTYTLNQGSNRFGEYGKNTREAIARHERVIRELTA